MRHGAIEDLVKIDWDVWRSRYPTLTDEEQIAFARCVEQVYPDQDHANYDLVRAFLQREQPQRVLEVGGYHGKLADTMVDEFTRIVFWENIDPLATMPKSPLRCVYNYEPTWFRWWETYPQSNFFDVALSAHCIEHLNWADLQGLLTWLSTIPVLFLETPLSQELTQDWTSYPGSHVLEVGWPVVIHFLEGLGYTAEQPDLFNQNVWEFRKCPTC